MPWRIAKSLAQLRKQIDDQSPNRNRASDGSIGDLAHQKEKSEHNPNSAGVVTAIDITHDPAHGVDMNVLAESIIKDPRVWYVIWNGRIRYHGGQWQRYTGKNPHDKHLHVSVKQDAKNYDNAALWNLGNVKGANMAFVPDEELTDLRRWKDIGLRYEREVIPAMDKDKQAWVDRATKAEDRATKAEAGQAHLDKALKGAYDLVEQLKAASNNSERQKLINEFQQVIDKYKGS